jgi:hypothetical protein
VQVAERAIREECVVKWKNSLMPHNGSAWFGQNGSAAVDRGIAPALEGTTTVQNGQASQTRLFEV